jgi:hypothetical protein
MGQKCQAIKDVNVLIQLTANPVEPIMASPALFQANPPGLSVIVRASNDFRYHEEQFGLESKRQDFKSSFLLGCEKRLADLSPL